MTATASTEAPQRSSTATTVTEVPFSALTAPETINARGADKGKGGIGELAASIDAKGLIVPLAVRPADGKAKRYEVIDGRRRFQALQMLVRDRKWSRSDSVPVIDRNEDDQEALETSLIANIERAPMHPVDQHAVFARLSAGGRTTAEIAARFGLAERTVRQRLALGRLAPKVLDAWKAGRIDEKAAQAFTLADSHATQEAALATIQRNAGRNGRIDDWRVKSELTASKPSARSVPQAMLDAYLAAGGTVTESLFEDERLIDEPALLKRVRHEAAEARRAALLAEGWSWVALSTDLDWRWQHQWDSVLGDAGVEMPPLTPEEQARFDELDDVDVDDDAALSAAQDEQLAIMATARARQITPEMRARSGVVIDMRVQSLECTYGLIRPDDVLDEPDEAPERDDETEPHADGAPSNAPGGRLPAGESEGANEDDPVLSNALVESITTWQTLAVADALPESPRLALRAAIAALTCEARWDVPLTLQIDSRANLFSSPRTGKSFADTLAGLDGLSDVELLARLARLMCTALDLVAHHATSGRDGQDALVAALPAEDYLAAARARFLPEDYFRRAPRQAALDALDEMVEAGLVPAAQVEALADAKKGDVVAVAARAAGVWGWLPPLIRHPGYGLKAPSET